MVHLPWDRNSLIPFLSESTVTFIYDTYYHNCVNNLNNLSNQYPELKQQNVPQIISNYPSRTLFNNVASEILNHEFFFRCLSPNRDIPSGRLYNTIIQQFKSFENFIQQFTDRVINHFGSGWVWLVFDPTSKFLNVVDGDNAYNPIADGYIPLLALDIWEHAYIFDYGIDKRDYVNNFWQFINWKYVEQIASERIFQS